MHGQQVLYSPDGNVWFLEGGNVFGREWRVGRTLEGRSNKKGVQGTKSDLPCDPIRSIA